jgi:hypothetical protein
MQSVCAAGTHISSPAPAAPQTTQLPGERSYHVFYQLVAGASKEQCKLYHLPADAADFNYLSKSGCLVRCRLCRARCVPQWLWQPLLHPLLVLALLYCIVVLQVKECMGPVHGMLDHVRGVHTSSRQQ